MRIKINTDDIAKKPSAFRNLKPSRGFTLLNPAKREFRQRRNYLTGFTLIELLVVISLFVALTTIALLNQSKFNGSILLTNLAYDVALTIRQAQSFGVNVREAGGGTGAFDHAYGVHFDTTSGAGKDKQFILFEDDNDNNIYDGNWVCKGGGDECLDNYFIKRGNYISGICVTTSTGSDCTPNKLDITFKRPNPDAIIKTIPFINNIIEAKIEISSADGNTRTVSVYSTGQIAVGR